jgi:hypothetical protein
MPATTAGEFFVDEYLRDPSFYGQSLLWNPATEDPYSDQAVRQRIYSQLQGSGQLKPSFDALNAPTSSWTSGGTDYGSALNIPDAPDRDGGIGEWLKILGTFAALPAGAGLVSGALGAGAAGMGGGGGPGSPFSVRSAVGRFCGWWFSWWGWYGFSEFSFRSVRLWWF